MARPVKGRRVCCLPESNLFGPLQGPSMEREIVQLHVDEYETLRLIDMEGLMQEECADRMHVARTTVQRIYNEARKKVAEAIVKGQILRIEGGNYELCPDGDTAHLGCSRCRRRSKQAGETP